MRKSPISHRCKFCRIPISKGNSDYCSYCRSQLAMHQVYDSDLNNIEFTENLANATKSFLETKERVMEAIKTLEEDEYNAYKFMINSMNKELKIKARDLSAVNESQQNNQIPRTNISPRNKSNVSANASPERETFHHSPYKNANKCLKLKKQTNTVPFDMNQPKFLRK